MTETQWERYTAGISGLVFVVIGGGILAVISPQAPYGSQATRPAIADYLHNHHAALGWQAGVSGAIAVVLLVFAASLWSIQRRAEGGTGWLATLGLVGGAIFGALTLMASAVEATLAFEGGRGSSAAILQDLWDLQQMTFTLLNFPITLFIAGNALSALRSRTLPSWLVWPVLILAGLFFIAGFSVNDPASGLADNAYLLYILLMLLILASSILLLMRGDRVDAAMRSTGQEPAVTG